MNNIDIPFSRDMAIAAIDGWKIATTQSDKKGKPGDTFTILDPRIDGIVEQQPPTFRLLDIKIGRLEYIQYKCCRLEGADNPSEFEELWKSLHRGHFMRNKKYFIHFFARVI